MSKNYLLENFDFQLPRNLIAQKPLTKRDSSRLLYLDQQGKIHDLIFSDITALLSSDDILIFNDTKVLPALLFGKKEGISIQVNLLKKIAKDCTWVCLAKPIKKLNVNDIIEFAQDFSATVIENDKALVLRFNCHIDSETSLIKKHGKMPLPPYIKRDANEMVNDFERYQTVYGIHEGSVAAPTAGLHFTDDLMSKIKVNGVKTAYITLHVGGGTFLPIRSKTLDDHIMHSEYFEINLQASDLINNVKSAKKGKVISVGTTTLSALESVADIGGIISENSGETDIFIKPGYRFKVVDALITNFHLPKSTLFILISSFCGLDLAQKIYAHAIEKEYRFFSYGDACFIEMQKSAQF